MLRPRRPRHRARMQKHVTHMHALARHTWTFRTKYLPAPGRPKCRSQVRHIWPNSGEKSVSISGEVCTLAEIAKFGQIRPRLGRNRSRVGRKAIKVGRNRPKLANVWPRMAEHGRNRPLVEIAQSWSIRTPNLPNLVQLVRCRPDVGQIWPNLAEMGPIVVQPWPDLVEFGSTLARIWSKRCRIRPSSGSTSPTPV